MIYRKEDPVFLSSSPPFSQRVDKKMYSYKTIWLMPCYINPENLKPEVLFAEPWKIS